LHDKRQVNAIYGSKSDSYHAKNNANDTSYARQKKRFEHNHPKNPI
jgi:hypothetical protein